MELCTNWRLYSKLVNQEEKDVRDKILGSLEFLAIKNHETSLQTIVQDLDGSISDMAYIVFNILERKKNLIPTQSKNQDNVE